MYIKKVSIQNIRSIDHFEMEFEKPAGWHVIIGDNGSGKSSVVRAISLGLIGPNEALGLRTSWDEWLNLKSYSGEIGIYIEPSDQDYNSNSQKKLNNQLIPNVIQFSKTVIWSAPNLVGLSVPKELKPDPFEYNWNSRFNWFSAAYGPFRRFEGGNSESSKLFSTQPKLGAHLSVFGEDIALTEATEWLVKLNYQYLEHKEEGNIINDIKKLINSPDFLPHQTKLDSISSEGVVFEDGNGSFIKVNQLSDGYRSLLSMTFELIRRMIQVYKADAVFKNIRKNNMYIDLPGVVLIDEVDAHLHPSWQTRIGQWFTKYFPNIQFIVTTHSPLVCRACEKGSIWRLAAPGSDEESGEITGIARKRLIYGNILDAYGTEVFGDNVSISEDAALMRNRLGELYEKSMLGEITKKEEVEFEKLKAILPTFKVNIPNPQ